jgi:outer membrane receptor protein involved in Fe transport
VQAGLRVDTQTYDGSGDDEQIAPRFNVLYELNDVTRLRASWGRFYQSQAINELPVEDGVEDFYGAQYSDQLIVSFDRKLSEAFDLRVEAYRKRYQQMHPRFENLFDPLVLLPEMEFDRVMLDPVGARTEGIEILLRWESQEAWRAWLGYTWSQARDSIDGRMVPRSWDQRHAVSAGASWARGPWSITVTNSFHTGWPITKLELREDANGNLQPVVGERNASRLASYNSLDVRINRTYALPRGALEVYLEATNLFARENPCCIEYEVTTAADGTPRIEQELDYWLPLVPSIGVLWRY